MAKLADLSLEELYSRPRITSTVEAVIKTKEDFSAKCTNWCDKVCRLKHKDPPADSLLIPSQPVDVLIIQDYKAFDEPKFFKAGATIERKHLGVIDFIAQRVFRASASKLSVSYAVTSLLKCQLTKEDLRKGGKAPTDVIISKCHPYLFKEIELRKPKVIVSLSTSVSKLLRPGTTNNGNRGEILDSIFGVPFVPTLHPRILLMLRQNSSGKFWGPDFQTTIEIDFLKAANLVSGSLRVPVLDRGLDWAKERITVARSLDQVKSLTGQLATLASEGSVLSVDTETTGLDPYTSAAKLICIQFGVRIDGEIKAFVFPLWHRKNTWYEASEAWEFIAPLLTDERVLKIGHNLKFDILYIAATTGVRIKGILFDTMLLLHCINSGLQGQYGLKQAVWDWAPDLELGGYETRLPKLTKLKAEVLDEEEKDDE